MVSSRIAALAFAFVAASVATGTSTGCAGPGVQIMSTSHDDASCLESKRTRRVCHDATRA